MSKRKAEDIVSCCPVSKRFISLFVDCKSVEPLPNPERRAKRKLHAAEQDPGRLQPECKRAEGARHGASPSASPRDRGGGGARARPQGVQQAGALQQRDTSTAPTRSAPPPHAPPPNAPWNEVPCGYNSFQFWRVPLPKIEIAEIKDVGQTKIPEEMNCDVPEEAAEMEVELQN
ncbi:uncharacterized protein LOC144592416 [Rhinoraja longicauda]